MTLVNDILNYNDNQNQDFSSNIDNIINYAEKQICSQLKTLQEVIITNINISNGNPMVNKPSLWRKTISMDINGVTITQRTLEYCRLLNNESSAGIPVHYSEANYNSFLFSPIPDIDYVVNCVYYSQIMPLSNNNQTNLLTSELPQLLFAQCMVQACLYLKDYDRTQIWDNVYKESLNAVNTEDVMRNIDRNTKVEHNIV